MRNLSIIYLVKWYLLPTSSHSSYVVKYNLWLGRLWLRSRASVLLLEGCWFDSPGLHVEVSLGKILNPKLLMTCWSAPRVAATAVSVWMYVCMRYCKSLWTKASAKCPKMYNGYTFKTNSFDRFKHKTYLVRLRNRSFLGFKKVNQWEVYSVWAALGVRTGWQKTFPITVADRSPLTHLWNCENSIG